MSLIEDLESHEKNPNNKWGRYSGSNPENNEVSLLSLSSQQRRRTTLRNRMLGVRPQTIVVDDDKHQFQLRSNTDKSPGNFSAEASNFTIPKTKKATGSTKTSSTDTNSCVGEWLNGGGRKVQTQLKLAPHAQGRVIKRTNVNGEHTPRKIRRPWNSPQDRTSDENVESVSVIQSPVDKPNVNPHHNYNRFRYADAPKLKNEMQVEIIDLKNQTDILDKCEKFPDLSKTVGRERLSGTSSLEARSRYAQFEEMRCLLCDGRISDAGCLTCPKSSDENELLDNSTENNFDVEDNGAVETIKEIEPGGRYTMKDKNNERGLSKGKQRKGNKEDKSSSNDNAQESEKELLNIDSSQENDFSGKCLLELQDSDDFIETPPSEVPSKSTISQGDIFCQLCGKGKTKQGCGCPKSAVHSTDKFYRRINKRCPKYSGKKYGSSKAPPVKRKRISLAFKKPSKNEGHDSDYEPEKPIRGIKKKAVELKTPECYHISSDEDIEADTNGLPEASIDEQADVKVLDKHQDSMPGRVKDDMRSLEDEKLRDENPLAVIAAGKELDDEAENSTHLETEGYWKLGATYHANGIQTKRSNKRQKKLEKKVNLPRADEFFVMVRFIFVGSLWGIATDPVLVTEDRMTIKMRSSSGEEFEFKLEKNNIASFMIHSECKPLCVLLKPTPGWARKYIERYHKHGVFIDPGSELYSEKHIFLLLDEVITGTSLEALIELIDVSLSDEPVVKKISEEEATLEAQRMHDAFEKSVKRKSDSSPSSTKRSFPTTAPNDENKKKKAALPPIKTYSTRSKSLPSFPNLPAKKILVYQTVTISDKDLRCLEPNTYLNDVIIDFFLKYTLEEKFSAVDKERIHLFSVFFYARLTQRNANEERTPANMHGKVKSWTKNVDIFAKDFLIIPINESSHWFMVIICYPRMVAELLNDTADEVSDSQEEISLDTTQEEDNEFESSQEIQEKPASKEDEINDEDTFDKNLLHAVGESKKRIKKKKKSNEDEGPITIRPCLLVFDSIGGCRRPGVISNLRHYLTCEWKERKSSFESTEIEFNKDTLKACYPKVPHQVNYSDCGLYLLQYFECFFTNPIKDYRFPIELRDDWVIDDIMETKRQHITKTIYELQEKENSKKTT